MKKFRKAFCVLLMLAMVSTMLTACSRAYTFADYSGQTFTFLAQGGITAGAVIRPTSDTTATADLTNVAFTMNKVTRYFTGPCEVKLSGDHILFKPAGVNYYYCGSMCKDAFGNIVSVTTSDVKYSLVY